MLILILYVISLMLLLAGCFLYKKSEICEEVLKGAAFAMILVILIQMFVAGLYSVLGVPVTPYTIGMANGSIGIFLIFCCLKYNKKQSYIFDIIDFIANLILLIVVLIYGIVAFGFDLSRFHYETVDMGNHLLKALEIASNQKVSGMYFIYGQVALWIQALEAFDNIYAYNIAIVIELLNLYLSGITFWYIIKKYAVEKWLKLIGLLSSIIYLLGYPLNGEIFGSQYLVSSIMLISILIVIFDYYKEKIWTKEISFFMMMLVCGGISISYLQFSPPVFVSLGLGLLLVEKKIKNIIVAGLKVFVIPCFMGIYFKAIEMLSKMNLTDILTMEGYIYRDFYSDFLLIIPFALAGIIMTIKKKDYNIRTIFFVITMFWVCIFLIGVLTGSVKGYYYYKNYYLLWLCSWMMGLYTIMNMEAVMRPYFISFACVWTSVAFIHFTGIDDYLMENYLVLNQSTKSGMLFSVYDFNINKVRAPGVMDKKQQELFTYARDLIIESNTEIPIIYSPGGLVYPYYGFTEQLGYRKYIYEKEGWGSFWNSIEECKYLTICYGSDSDSFVKALDRKERVYENDAGYIVYIDEMEPIVEISGMYESEKFNDEYLRWGDKTGSITYYNYMTKEMTIPVNFTIECMDNIGDNSYVTIEINGKSIKRVFKEGKIQYDLSLRIEPGETKVIKWDANVERIVAPGDSRKLYIFFSNYDDLWEEG